MAQCMKLSRLYIPRSDNVYLGAYQGTKGVVAEVYVPDASNTDLSLCQSVAISGAELAALRNVAPSSNDMNVTADIFVGSALVLCFALGWIAGGQR